MAKALKLRQVAKNLQRQADAYSALAKAQDQAAKALPRTTTPELIAAIAADDAAIRSYYTADGQQSQADQYTALADAAFAAGDAAEAP